MEHEVTIIPIVIGAFGTVTKGLLKGLDDMEVGGRVEIIQTTALLRTVQNTEKSPGDLRELAVTQIPVKNYQLTQMWKALKGKNNDNNKNKARIDKMQQNSKYRPCGNGDETINHIISECSKLAQKEYKVRHDWVRKVIHWEMCKKFQFDHANKWYMHNPAPVLENDTHKDLIIINKKNIRKFAKLSTLLSRLTTE